MARVLTARLGKRSPIGCHESPASVLFQTPPATPALYIMLGLAESIKNARVRPPMFPGPKGCQTSKPCCKTGEAPAGEAPETLVTPGECFGILAMCSLAVKNDSTGSLLLPGGNRRCK